VDSLIFLVGNPNPPEKKEGWKNTFSAHAAQFFMEMGNIF